MKWSCYSTPYSCAYAAAVHVGQKSGIRYRRNIFQAEKWSRMRRKQTGKKSGQTRNGEENGTLNKRRTVNFI